MKWQVDFCQEWVLHEWGTIRRDTSDLESGCPSYPHNIQWRANLESLLQGQTHWPETLRPLCVTNLKRPGTVFSLRGSWHGPSLLLYPTLALKFPLKSEGAEPKSNHHFGGENSFVPLWIHVGQEERKFSLYNQRLSLKGGKWQYVSKEVTIFTLLGRKPTV